MHDWICGKLREVARAKFEPGATVQELQAFGFDPKTYRVTVNAWPETAPAWDLWSRIGNQWRVGAGGAVALDYNVLFHLLDRMELSKEDYDDLFEAVRVIEYERLEVWEEQREKERACK